MNVLKLFLRVAITLAMVAVAVVLGVALWQVYMVSPWTRDGRVRAYVVDIAPEVAGTVVQLLVHDNEFVHKGDALFAIDPSRYRLSVAQAQASLEGASDSLRLRQSDVRRRAGLTGIVSAEEQEQFRSQSSQAQSNVDSAQAQLDTAKLNLQRAVVFAPVNGYVTNLLLRVGDYATAGQPRLALVDADSFWVNGYFEETKLEHVSVGDPARVRLMGYKPILDGHVDSIARGVNDQNQSADSQGLQDVNPIFTWVRLAQRIPVRVHIDRVPPGIVLAAGMTASVSVGAPAPQSQGTLVAWLQDHL
jgi:multidrug resistance efflux pump